MSPLPLIAIRSDVAALRIWPTVTDAYTAGVAPGPKQSASKSGRGGTVKRLHVSRVVQATRSV